MNINRGGFRPASGELVLYDYADLTTFIHESGHFFLEALSDMASRADAPAQVRQDMDAVLEWFGLPGGDAGRAAWRGMSLKQKRSFHEQFARGFEVYAGTGEAPSAALTEMFERFKEWIVGVYADLRRLNVEVSPEVARVFDRLLVDESEQDEREVMATGRQLGSGLPAGGLRMEELAQESVRKRLRAEVMATGLIAEDVADIYAAMVARFYATQGKSLGVSALEMQRRYPLSVKAECISDATELSQRQESVSHDGFVSKRTAIVAAVKEPAREKGRGRG